MQRSSEHSNERSNPDVLWPRATAAAAARRSVALAGAVGGAVILGGAVAVLGGAVAALGCILSTEDACARLAASRCAHYADCAPSYLAATYGDEATCRDRALAECEPLPTLPGADVGPGDIEACADAYAHQTCDDLLLEAPPEACRFTGKKPNGEGCATGAQCQSSFCDLPAEQPCGRCAAVRKQGSPCSKGGSPCDAGLHCADSGLCEALGAEGDACDAAAPCASRFSCSSGLCAAPLGPGEPCHGDVKCDPLLGLHCNPGTGVCEPLPTTVAKQTCTACGAKAGYPTCE